MTKPKGNKNFMSLSKKECITVAKETNRNANEIYNDGIALAKNNSYGRATTLLILSMEESMKAVILYLDGNGFEFRKRVKGIKNLFVNHKLRYPLALVLSGFNIFQNDLKKLFSKVKTNPTLFKDFNIKEKKWETLTKTYILSKVKQLIKEIIWFSNAEYLRQEGLYVDYNDILMTPLNISKQEYHNVNSRVGGLKDFIDEFMEAFDEKGGEGEVELKEHLKSLQKKFITEGWYDKIGDMISKFNSKGIDPLQSLLVNVKEIEGNLKEDFTDEEI